MKNEFWLSLPSKDLIKSRVFFQKLGFTFNDRFPNAEMVSMFMGPSNFVLNLFPENIFQSFINHKVTNTAESNEIVFSLGASSVSEVDQFAKNAVAAGANLYANPGFKDGWMYGCGFVDLDGHRWSVLYMDMSKMPK